MKKIIYMVALGVIFLAGTSVVNAAWNTYPSDCPNPLSIGNYTTGEGIQNGSNGCWTKRSVSADAGQTINVAVFYDNTNNQDANNVVINLNQSPAGSMSSQNSTYSFSGSLNSSVGSLGLSTVTANLTSPQTLTFSQAKLFRKSSTSGVSLPNGQSGYEAFNGGLNLGTITRGDWGTIIFSFTVGTTVTPPQHCVINNFSASPTSITAGDSSTLSWNTSNCNSVSISPTVGSVNAVGNRTVYPNTTTTYTLTAYDPTTGQQQTRQATVNVNQIQNNCVISSFSASPSSINFGDSSTLSWNTSNCTNVSISPSVGNVNVSGSRVVYPVVTTTYTLSAYDFNGQVQTKQATVNVNQIQNNCAISSFYASPTSITAGDSSTLSWNTSNCTNINITPAIGGVTAIGNRTVYPNVTTTYTLTGVDPITGQQQSRQATVYVDQVNNNVCTISKFTIDNDTSSVNVTRGDRVRIAWNTEDCSSVQLSGPDFNSSSLDGSEYFYPERSGNYTLSAYRSGDGYKTKSIYLYVDNYNNDNCYYGNCNNDYYNNPTVSTYYPSNVTSNSARLSGYVNGNGSRVNSWIEFPCGTYNYNYNYNSGNRYDQRYNESYSNLSTNVYNLNPGTVYNFCAVAEKNGQIYRGNSVSFTTGSANYPIPVPIPLPVELNKNVVTTVATNIGKTEAYLNGYITSSQYYNSNVYFDYGTTVDLGLRTASKSTNGNSTFSSLVNGLSPNTIYYFQAVGTGPDGLISKGNIEVFKTLGNTQTTKTVIVQQGKTIIGKESPVLLNITNKYQVISQGDLVDYVVTYKNIGKSILLRPMVQVVLPTNMTLVNASRGTYSIDTHTLSAPIENLEPGQEGVIFLQARVDTVPENNAQIVTTAIFVYTNTSSIQENTMNYVINVPGLNGSGLPTDQNSMLGGSAFFAGLQSIGLLGWLLIILIVMLIVLIARSYNGRRDLNNIHANHTH